MASGVTTAAFAYQGAQRLATESTGVFGKALGKAGVYGAVALGAFEVFKAGNEIYRDVSGKTAAAAKATAQFNDAVKNAGISLDSLSETARNQKVASAEGALYNLGVKDFKNKEIQKLYAETAYQTGMGEEEFRKMLIEKGATKERVAKTGQVISGTNIDDLKKAAAEVVPMPEKFLQGGAINPEYEKRIKVLAERKKELAEIQRDINQADKDSNKTTEEAKVLNAAKVSFLQLQLENRIKYKDALFEAMNAEEYSLNLQKEMLSVGESDRIQADYKLQSLQAAKKATLEQSSATVELLKNSTLITNKLQGAGIGLDEIDVIEFDKIAGVSEKISDLIKKQGGYTKEVANEADRLLQKIVPEQNQREQILALIKETNGEITKRIDLENKVNALSNLQKATLEASNFAAQKRLDSITSGYDVTLKQNEIAKRNLDLDLEAFKIQKEREKIGKGSAAAFAIDKEIIDKEKFTLDAKLKIDKQDLITQVQKTLADEAIRIGARPDQIAKLDLGKVQTKEGAIKAARKIEQIEKEIQINKINIAQKEFESKIEASKLSYDYTIEAAKEFKNIVVSSLPKNKENFTDFVNRPTVDAFSVTTAGTTPQEDLIQRSRREAAEAINTITNTPSSLNLNLEDTFQQISILEKESKNLAESLENSLLTAGASLTTFGNLINDVFKNLSENITQNKFALLTATDSQSIISNAVDARRNAILQQGPQNAGTIASAAGASAIYEKELQIKRAITYQDKINGELELRKLKEILPLRLELLNAETNEERESIIDKIIAKEKQRLPLSERVMGVFSSTEEERAIKLEDTIVDASIQFKNNLIDGISKAIEEGGTLADILKGGALDFVRTLNKQLMSNMFDSIVGSGKNGSSGLLGTILGYSSGGPITGGSGTKDDVPAMLMGGEYVINKKSVGKYGPQFLEAINNGTLGGYAQGGRVQSGKGGFFTPGTYGLGGIQGTRNLLKFATQGYTSGSRDQIVNEGNYASINLEPESLRLTNFGRSNSPQAEATRAAKEQAFGLYVQEMQAQAEAKKQAEAEKDAFKNQLIMLGITAVGGYFGGIASKGFKQGFAGAGKDATMLQKLQAGFSGVGEKFGNVGSGIKSLFSGNSQQAGNLFGIAQTNFANPKEAFNFALERSGISYNDLEQDQISEVNQALGSLGLPGLSGNNNNVGYNGFNPPAFSTGPFDAQGNYIEERANNRFATGGSIPSAGGIDTVPAMLSGGEFIMNRSAAQNIGAGNLQAFNAGAGSIVTEEKTEELNEKLIAKLDELIEASSAAGNITINVDGSTGKSSQTTDGGASEQKQQLARQIKDVVLKVIQDEKRLGGSLRK
jgi:hypothetical protein